MTDHTPLPGHAPALPWDAAFDETDTILGELEGLSHAAKLLLEEHPRLNTSDPADLALDVVLRTLTEKHLALRHARSAEYRAGLALRQGSVS